MRWIVEGADLNTGSDTTTVIEAETAEEAEQKALARCMLVSTVKRAPAAPPPGAARAAPPGAARAVPPASPRADPAPPRAEPAAPGPEPAAAAEPPGWREPPRAEPARPAPAPRRVVRPVRRVVKPPLSPLAQLAPLPPLSQPVAPPPGEAEEAGGSKARPRPESVFTAPPRAPLTVPAEGLTPLDPPRAAAPSSSATRDYADLERGTQSLRRLSVAVTAAGWLSLLAGGTCVFAALGGDAGGGGFLAQFTPAALASGGAAALACGLMFLLAAAFARTVAGAADVLRGLARGAPRK